MKVVTNAKKKIATKSITESNFWKQSALQQQALIHAKHRT